jgi:Ni/Co efflux regulator RcnB
MFAVIHLTLLATPGFAQDKDRRDDHNGYGVMIMNHHDEHPGNSMMMQAHHGWQKGDKIGRDDWCRGERIAGYHRYHLNRPRRGYEWRRVENRRCQSLVETPTGSSGPC